MTNSMKADMDSNIDSKIKAFVAKSSIPHLAVGIWHNGQFYSSNYGFAAQPTVDVFEIGSVSKTFTAALLAVLVERNLVSLSDKVDRFNPDLPFVKDITLLQLATHTSGLPRDPFKGLVLNGQKALNKFSHSEYLNFLSGFKKPLKSGKFNYSNIGTALLGNILADHIGCTYEEAVKKYILEPLGMLETHILPEAYDEQRLALGHDGNGKVVPHFMWASMEPAGIWRSTTKDMMIFLKAHLGYSGKEWRHLLAKTTQPAYDDAKLAHIGLAWMLDSKEELGNYAWHNGGTLGQKSVVACLKERDAAIVMLSNKAPRLWHNFLQRYSIEELSLEIMKTLVKDSY